MKDDNTCSGSSTGGGECAWTWVSGESNAYISENWASFWCPREPNGEYSQSGNYIFYWSGPCEPNENYVQMTSDINGCLSDRPDCHHPEFNPGQICEYMRSYCPMGTFNVSGTSCLPCPAGSFCTGGAPTLCPPGSACPPGSITPAPCPSATFASTGAPTCTPCPAGATSPANSSTADACLPCPAGRFCPVSPLFSYPCKAGYFGATGGQMAATCSGACSAPPGFGCLAGATSPVPVRCPVGHFCPGGSPAPATPCMSPALCNTEGLSSEPPCVWNANTLVWGACPPFDKLATDQNGVVYVTGGDLIRRVTTFGVVSTLAGGGGRDTLFNDGTGTAVSFDGASAIAVSPVTGDIFCSEIVAGGLAPSQYRGRIRRITLAGVVTTFAGGASTGIFGSGVGTNARFYLPYWISIDSAGILYVGEWGRRISMIDPSGVVSTLATLSAPFSAGALGELRFRPMYFAVDSSRNVFVRDDADDFGTNVRQIFPNGTVATVYYKHEREGGRGLGFYGQLLVAGNGSLLVVDSGPYLGMITPPGYLFPLSGGGSGFPYPLISGYQDGYGTSALFNSLTGVSISTSGVITVADGCHLRSLTCSPCPATFYCSTGVPLPCPPGSACPLGTTTPVLCPAGSACPRGTASPALCPPATFSGEGAVACTPCPASTTSPANSSSSAACAPPTTCPAGFFCPESPRYAYPCLAGYYGGSVNLTNATCSGPCSAPHGFGCLAGATSPVPVRCPAGHFCPGGSPAPATPCGTPSNCAEGGLSSEPPCVWNVVAHLREKSVLNFGPYGLGSFATTPSGSVLVASSGRDLIGELYTNGSMSVTTVAPISGPMAIAVHTIFGTFAGTNEAIYSLGSGTFTFFASVEGRVLAFDSAGILFAAGTTCVRRVDLPTTTVSVLAGVCSSTPQPPIPGFF